MRYRIYFHRRENAPQVWSVDCGTPNTEIHVQAVQVLMAAYTQVDLQAPNGAPRAWMQVDNAKLEMQGAIAVFKPV